MGMFDNLDFTKQDKAIAKLKSQGFKEFGREKCPTGAVLFRKGKIAKKANYDGTIEKLDFDMEKYDNYQKNSIVEKLRTTSGVAPAFGHNEVIAEVGKISNPQKTVVKVLVVGTALFLLGRWAVKKLNQSDIKYK